MRSTTRGIIRRAFVTVGTTDLADNAVTDAKLRDSAALSVIGRSANSSGDPADIAASADGQVLRRASSLLGFGAVDLADGDAVTGALPIGNGGTGQTTATAAFDALAPSTTQGDVIYYNGTDNVRLGVGTSGQFLKTNGAAANPAWAAEVFTFGMSCGDSGGFNPSAASVYYFSDFFGLDPTTTTPRHALFVPATGTITKVWIRQLVLGTNGVAGENITYVLRKNTATDSSTIATLDTDDDITDGSNLALAFAVTVGDELTGKFTTPAAWTTAPTIMFVSFRCLIETP